MCGIAGILDKKKISREDVALVKKMNEAQKHRGPNDEGIYVDDFCCLGHRRLSIIDLSMNGHQPFFSDDHRYVLTYNGEIYNYIELRAELERLGWIFRTKTDTEVLLKAYQQYGKDCLNKFNGMFAFAIYDTKNHSVFIARDRFGIKPLYYTLKNNKFYFASEIKALRLIADLKCSINDQAVFDYLVFNRTDIHDETFIVEIKRLPKGYYGIYDADKLNLTQWWNPESFLRKQDTVSNQDVCNQVEEILCSAVQLRMRSDVSVGSCLSGGLDSSILIGILYDRLGVDKNYPTFTISYPGHSVDESSYINRLKNRFPFINYQSTPTQQTIYNDLHDYIYINDEPTTGPSFYSQYKLMQLVHSKNVTVLLNGQGGDENFAGYHYFHGFYLTGLLQRRKYVKFILNFAQIIARQQDKTAYQSLAFQLLSDTNRKYWLLKHHPYMQYEFFNQNIKSSRIYNEFFNAPNLNTSIVRHFQYKLEHLLRMEDRNSMAFSIETRLPYLDYRLVEYLLSVPEDMKIRSGETKYLQKKSLQQYTIPEITDRKDKIGFGTPHELLQTLSMKAITHKSIIYCKDIFPNVFTKHLFECVEKDTMNLWKINQLALWHQMIDKR